MAKISNFRGLISDADVGDVPEGSASNQVNVTTHKPGILTPRKGIQPATLGTAQQIDSGYNVFQRMCFCKTRIGWSIGVNGIDRGFIWNGIDAATQDLGVDKPTDGPTITLDEINPFSGTAITAHTGGEYKFTHTGAKLQTGDKIFIGHVKGTDAMEGDLNTKIHTVTRIGDDDFYLADTTKSGTYEDDSGAFSVTEQKRDLSGTALTSSTGATGGLIKVTHTDHNLSTGMQVKFTGVRGTLYVPTDVNGSTFTITVLDANNFTLDGTVWEGTYVDGTGSFTRLGEGMTEGTYICAVRYRTKNVPAQFSSISVTTYVTAQTADKMTWSNIVHSASTRVDAIELWRTTAGQQNVMYKIGEIANSPGSSPSSFTDIIDDINTSNKVGDETMVIIDSDGTLIARRFEPPPDWFKYVTMFQDRYFYFGTVKYNKSTCYRSGTKTITGVTGSDGTLWPATFKGRYIQVSGSNQLNYIDAVDVSNQILTVRDDVSTNVSNSSSSPVSYTILPAPSTKRQLLFSYFDEPESVPLTNSITLQSNHGDDDEIVGAMPYGPYLYILAQRHKYSFSYATNPLTDGAVRFLDDRGSFNNDCWDIYSNEAYLMDDNGVYSFDGSESTSISKQIQDLFRQDGSIGSIDYSKSDRFFVKIDRGMGRVYCFVSFVGDTGTYPKRALVYNIRRKSWDLMEYPVEITDAASIEQSGKPRMIVSSENEAIYLVDEGTTDVVTSETTGTATSSSNSTLVSTGAGWTVNAFVSASVYITDGKGKGQRRTISTNTGDTLNISPNWTTNPDSTSKFSVGAIPWSWKSGSFSLKENDEREKREISFKFAPTTNDHSMDLRTYYNNETDPISYAIAQDLGDAVQIKEDNKEDVVINMGKDYSDLEESVGREKFRFDGMYSGVSHGDHRVAFEMRGHSGAQVPEIQMIEITGVASPAQAREGGEES